MPETPTEKVFHRLAYVSRRLLPLTGFDRALGPVHRYTLMSLANLRQMYRNVTTVVDEGIRGDLAECGCARGGNAAFLGRILKQKQALPQRQVWLFDTFEGLPAPTANDPDYEQAKEHTGGCLGTLDEVRGLIARSGIEEHYRFVKGLFQETLARTDTGALAVLHVDGDWYDSTLCVLNELYDRVTPGGFIQIDDYHHWEGCRKATDEFLRQRGPTVKLEHTGSTAVYFRKP